jgi:hypothetical protein
MIEAESKKSEMIFCHKRRVETEDQQRLSSFDQLTVLEMNIRKLWISRDRTNRSNVR